MADATDTATSGDEPTRPGGFLRETGESLASVFGNPNLRRIQLAFAGSAIGDWAYATAVAVWAYDVGGAKAVGIWMAIRLALMALTAPLGAILADKMDRKRLMVICDLGRAVLVALAALCLFLDTPAWPVFVLATLAALLGSPFRVAQRALLPSLADRPAELTASNGASSTIESLAIFVGPALGALMLGFTTVQVVFLLNVVTYAWSLLLVLGIRPRARSEAPDPAAVPEDESGSGGADPAPGFLAETMAGFALIGRDRSLLLVTVAVAAQTVVAGATVVFMVVMADEILGTGARGVGFLDSVTGIGSIVGGIVAIGRAAKGRLAADMTVGVVLWSLPLLLVTIWPEPVACFVAVLLLGLGNPLVDANMDTIVQRITPDALLGRVFGALEACLIATMALGALVMPFLIDWLGLQGALAAIAVPVGGLMLVGLPTMMRIDARLRAPETLPLVTGIDLFAPLPAKVLESLAGALIEVRVAAGEEILREGGESDLFYLIQSGQVQVTQENRLLRHEGPGDYFGEIGLLRDVPRTATITAVEDTVLQTLAREDFLRAVTGHRESRLAAENMVTRRLAV